MNGRTEVTVLDLLGRRVLDADGRSLGLVRDLEAERRDGDLRVTRLLVGTSAWRTRLSWKPEQNGRMVAWEDIESIFPVIRLRRKVR